MTEMSMFRRLDAAFRSGDSDTIRRELGSEPGFPNVEAHPAMGSCLTYAIYHSPVSLVAELLDAGADPNAPADDGFPPLLAAVSCLAAELGAAPRTDVVDLVRLLVDRGADTGQRGTNDYTALHLAAYHGDLAVVEALLELGADADAVTRIDDPEVPLETASLAGHAHVVERLRPVTRRLDWDDAVRAADDTAVRRMLRAGHPIDQLDAYGRTALMRAAHAGHREVVEVLVGAGADLDRTAKYHLSAMMLAVVAGHPRIVRLLARAGADPTITGSGAPGFHGKTAADLAAERGDARLASFLRNVGPPT